MNAFVVITCCNRCVTNSKRDKETSGLQFITHEKERLKRKFAAEINREKIFALKKLLKQNFVVVFSDEYFFSLKEKKNLKKR